MTEPGSASADTAAADTDRPRVEFRVLGPFQVVVGDRTVSIGPGKVRSLLAALLARPNEFVPVGWLIEAVWGAEPPVTARGTLRNHVLRLRRALSAGSTAGDLIRTRPGGYSLEIGPDDLDVLLFQQLAGLTRRSGDARRESLILRSALALWRGPAYSDVESDLLHLEEVPRLTELWLQLVERRVDLDLAAGATDGLVAELTGLTGAHPHRERFWAQLMTALTAGGRQGEALAAYRRVHRLLTDDLGIGPGLELRTLERQILHRSAAGPSLSRQPPRASGAGPGGCRLPLDITDLTGRELLTQRVVDRLGSAERPAVVALSGQPGVGKTALALRAAHRLRDRFDDGQWFLRLGSAHRTGAVLAEMLLLTGLSVTQLPASEEARSALLRARLADMRVLVLLDDAVSAQQVLPLLPGAGGSAVLVTGHRRLTELRVLAGAATVTVPLLTAADADDLILSLSPESAAEPAARAALGGLCGFLPLALRIAVTKADRPGHGIAAAVAELSGADRLTWLSVGAPVPVSVRAALEVAYGRLSAAACTCFVGLAPLAGTTFGSVEARACTGLTAADGGRQLDELVESSMLEHLGDRRYRLPELLGLFALSLTGTAPQLDADARLAAAQDEPVATGL